MSIGKLVRPGLTLQGMAATGGVTVTGNITPGRTLEGILIDLEGTGADVQDDITLLRLKANGKTFFEGSGLQLSLINNYKKKIATGNESANYLHLDFTEANCGRDYLDQMIGAFDTSQGVANITAEITVGNITSGGTIQWYLIESEPQRDKNLPYAGMMSKLLRYTASPGAAGNVSIALPFGPVNGAIVKRLHLDSTIVTGWVVKQDGIPVHEFDAVADNTAYNTVYGRTPQTNFHTIDFMVDGNVRNAFDTRNARNMELIATVSGAGSVTVLAEYLDVLGNL